jgi:multidrug resistance efflux pump
VVSGVYVHPGEWATPGSPVVEILDTSSWQVETRNVSELDIGRVKVGQQVQLGVFAFPGEGLIGRVTTISPVAVVQQGDTTYTLTIEIEPTDLDLRSGMNARVELLLD